jgi:hypothetical protein
MGQEQEFSQAVFLLVASLVDSRGRSRSAGAVAEEVAYWLSFILSLRLDTQSRSPVMGLILTHKDELPRQGRSAEAMRTYNASVLSELQRLVPAIATEEVPTWNLDARSLSEACSMLGWLADQHARLVDRLPQVPRLTLRAGEVIRHMRARGTERCMRCARRAASIATVW